MQKADILVGREIAEVVGVSDRTISRWFREGRLPGAFKIGGRNSPIRMPRRALNRVLRGAA